MEIWEDVKGYEGLYQVSNFGKARSLTRMIATSINNNKIRKQIGRVLSLYKDKGGYPRIQLCALGDIKTKTIHTLVWDAFGDKPRNGRKLQIDHIDNNKSNNHISNLQLLTPRENVRKRFKKKEMEK